MATFTLPNGTKVRTQSQSRWILIAQLPDGRASIVRRSASKETIVAVYRRESVKRATNLRWFIGDQTTGQAVDGADLSFSHGAQHMSHELGRIIFNATNNY